MTVAYNALASVEKRAQEFNKFEKEHEMLLETPGNKIMEVRCFSKDNFPNGDNRVIETTVNTTLLELILKV